MHFETATIHSDQRLPLPPGGKRHRSLVCKVNELMKQLTAYVASVHSSSSDVNLAHILLVSFTCGWGWGDRSMLNEFRSYFSKLGPSTI